MTLFINGKTYEAGELIAYVKTLEKENAELKQAKEGKVVEHFEAYGQCRDSRRIAELEAQIAKLKKQYDIVRNERNLFQERCEDILENYYCDHKCKCADLEKENAELKEKLKPENCP